jgi:hypothetical protein
MPRLSLWKDGAHTNDYKFFDRRISEMFTLGGTGILLHKYLGTNAQGLQLTTNAAQTAATVLNFPNTSSVNLGDLVTGTNIPANTTVIAKNASTVTLSRNTTATIGMDVKVGFSADASQPSYTNQSEQNIQDLLWTENRDRKYDTSIYKMRGLYQRSDQDFDLSQFGLFLQTGTLFIVFHLRDMMDQIGRKLMAGDVLEFQHLTDYDALNQDVPAALKRFYVVSDASWPAEGFTPTWWPHLWRVKVNPLVDSQEYKDILNNIMAGDSNTPIGKILSTLDTNLAMNDAVIAKATQDLPKSGYNTDPFYDTLGIRPGPVPKTADDVRDHADEIRDTADEGYASPTQDLPGYLVGDNLAPNGLPMGAGILFPTSPGSGDFFLRTDYVPNRIFRYDGARWIKFNDVQRTSLTQGRENMTTLGTFVNTPTTPNWTTVNGESVPYKQSLSKAMTPKADN